jgi:hypothetical protein
MLHKAELQQQILAGEMSMHLTDNTNHEHVTLSSNSTTISNTSLSLLILIALLGASAK